MNEMICRCCNEEMLGLTTLRHLHDKTDVWRCPKCGAVLKDYICGGLTWMIPKKSNMKLTIAE